MTAIPFATARRKLSGVALVFVIAYGLLIIPLFYILWLFHQYIKLGFGAPAFDLFVIAMYLYVPLHILEHRKVGQNAK